MSNIENPFFGRNRRVIRQDKTWTFNNRSGLTLSEYEDWEQFKADTGIIQSDTNELLFNQLIAIHYNTILKFQSKDQMNNSLRFIIEQEADKYDQSTIFYNSIKDKLLSEIEETNVFKIGSVKDEISDFDKYKSGRQTKEKNYNDILKRYEDFNTKKTPLETSINAIIIKIKHIAYRVDNRGSFI